MCVVVLGDVCLGDEIVITSSDSPSQERLAENTGSSLLVVLVGLTAGSQTKYQ